MAAQSKPTKECGICYGDVKSFKTPPQDHMIPHGEYDRFCGDCWENHLSLWVDKDHKHIPCMLKGCKSLMSYENLASLARVGTMNRYAAKLVQDEGLLCMQRCGAMRQPFDREKNGRVFTCKQCAYQVCVDCDRPEHANESCDEYQSRVVLAPVHVKAEAATLAVFKTCPECNATIKTDRCAYTQCECGHRFCSRCECPWVGENSAYMLGKEAHAEWCNYRTRDTQSAHLTKNRFIERPEVLERIQQKKDARALKRKAKEAELDED